MLTIFSSASSLLTLSYQGYFKDLIQNSDKHKQTEPGGTEKL